MIRPVESAARLAPTAIDRRLSVAPMMDWTDRHCRYFHRLLAPRALLYTEMVTTGAVLNGDLDHLLGHSPEEHPLALQLGGSHPGELARCAALAEQRGFDEVNLNIGCPSDRVQRGRFGACLMLEPRLVRDCIAAMRDAVDIPVTVKCRLGVDECDSYDYFSGFVHCVAESGCRVFIVHSRKAWLSGLSPRENRELPELRYDWVRRLKHESPQLTIVLNGGIATPAECEAHLRTVDGVMLGRVAYHEPWVLSEASRKLFGTAGMPTRAEAVHAMAGYAARQRAAGVPLKRISRHLLGLFHGRPGARQWRRTITAEAYRDTADESVLLRALAAVESAAGEVCAAA